MGWTGRCSRSSNITAHTNIWVRIDSPCALEQEIQSYDTVQFPPRPPELDTAYEERQMIGRLKRKLRINGLLDQHGNPRHGINSEKLVEEERRKQNGAKKKGNGAQHQQQQPKVASTKPIKKRKLKNCK
jgi:hypothetical protein